MECLHSWPMAGWTMADISSGRMDGGIDEMGGARMVIVLGKDGFHHWSRRGPSLRLQHYVRQLRGPCYITCSHQLHGAPFLVVPYDPLHRALRSSSDSSGNCERTKQCQAHTSEPLLNIHNITRISELECPISPMAT